MLLKFYRKAFCFVPVLILLVGWFYYSYAVSHEDSIIGIAFNYFAENNDTYYDSLELVEVSNNEEEESKEDTVSESNVQMLSYKSNVADLNNWVLPITGNYTITTYYGSGHKGIDYYSYNGYGSNILASNNGTVITVNMGCSAGDTGCNGRRGNYVVINHNNSNYYTMYMHLKDSTVSVGDTVSAGDVIAHMGNTGQVIPVPTSSNPYGGTHLHFEVYIGEPDRGGYTINPLNIVG